MIYRVKGLGKSVKLYRYYSYQLNQERIADFPSSYVTKGVCKKWNGIWSENNYFDGPENSAFKMILPPPNVTGALHLGHGYTVTIQDVLARWYRMKGSLVTWVPGLDHGGIATQAAVEKYLAATKGVKKNDLTKDEFALALEEWRSQKGKLINSQLKNLGASLDWSKEFYTMSKEHNNAVKEAFVTLNNRGLLYRKKDLVNWSPALKSTISDIEVDTIELDKKTNLSLPDYRKKISFGEIFDIAYKIQDSKEEILISTTRVESMYGDTAIAVNPDDSRYSHHIGKQVFHPLRQVFIPIIADSMVKMDFGTGALKITPAHSRVDLEVAQRHNLEAIEVINEEGNMNENAKLVEGLPRFLARQKILDELTNLGALRGAKDHAMTVPVCSRSGDVIEYLMKEQWFIRTKKMAEKASEAVRHKLLRIDPARFEAQWFDRLDNIRDWCVSRQLQWGHQIPAYICKNGSEFHWIVAKSLEDAVKISRDKFGADFTVKQDTDVLDTWFSAGLLPMSAMNWPHDSYQKYYPLSLMETGHDILFYWVARMVMLCTELSGKLPFNEVLLHGVLCDAQGKKMSKSLGNVINPEWVINGITLDNLKNEAQKSFDNGVINQVELKRTHSVNLKNFPDGIPECGIDALRFTLCAHDLRSDRISFNVIECKTNKHFCNKIWQACKYVLLVTDDKKVSKPSIISSTDGWILSKLSLMVDTVDTNIEQRHFHRAVLEIKQFFYYEFCDFFLEVTKLGLASNNQEVVDSHKWAMVKCLEVSLRVLAPFMPYLSEDLYSRLGKKLPGFLSIPSLMEAAYPTVEELGTRDEELESKFDDAIKIVLAMRNILSHVNKKSISKVCIVLDDEDSYKFYKDNRDFIVSTSRITNLEVFKSNEFKEVDSCIRSREAGCQLFYFLMDNEDVEKVKDNVMNKRLQVEAKLQKLMNKVSTTKYIDVTSEEEKSKNTARIENLQVELEKYPKFV